MITEIEGKLQRRESLGTIIQHSVVRDIKQETIQIITLPAPANRSKWERKTAAHKAGVQGRVDTSRGYL